MQHYLVPCLLVLCFTSGITLGGIVSRLKRSAGEKESPPIACVSAFEKCENNDRCRMAMQDLDHRCKVTDGQCNAGMIDLTRCGQVMDHMFLYGLPEDGCKCLDHDSKCAEKRKKVYDNQCFAAIRHLRVMHMFPKRIDAYDKVTEPEAITTTAALDVLAAHYQSATLVQEGHKTKKFIFDKNSSKKKDNKNEKSTVSTITSIPNGVQATANPPETHTSAASGNVATSKQFVPDGSGNKDVTKAHQVKKKVEILRVNSKKLWTASLPETESPKPNPRHDGVVSKGHLKAPFSTNNDIDQFNINAIQRQTSREHELRGSLQKHENNTDYKSIAIILGILLAIVVLSSLIIFLWTRTGSVIFYKGAKFIKDQRMDDEVYSTIQFSSPASSGRSQ